MNLKYLPLLPLLLLFCSNMEGQTIVSGSVEDESGRRIPNVSLFLKDSIADKTIAYLLSNEQGQFSFKSSTRQGLYLLCSNIAYEKLKVPVVLDERGHAEGLKLVMRELSYQLKELTITGKKSPIVIRNDTTIYRTDYFADGLESNIEELLKKLPGFNVSPDGVVTIGNKEVDRILVEGDDLFERSYKILSKNMPAYPIEEVEVIQNYVKNHLYKEMIKSDKIALNLKLKEESKNIWFGNIRGGVGSKSSYELLSNLMNFGKRYKTYHLASSNNRSGGSLGELRKLSEVEKDKEIPSLFSTKSPRELISMNQIGHIAYSHLRGNNDPITRSNLTSINALITLSKKNKLRIAGLYDYEKTGRFQRTTEDISILGERIRNNEEQSSMIRNQTGFLRIDFTSQLSKNSNFASTTMLHHNNDKEVADLLLNGITSNNQLHQKGLRLNQLLLYTQKIDDHTILSSTGSYYFDNRPQDYVAQHFYFSHLFPKLHNITGAKQSIGHSMQSVEGDFSLLKKWGQHQLLFQIGNRYRYHQLSSDLKLTSKDGEEMVPTEGVNQWIYGINDLTTQLRYTLFIGLLKLTTALNTHYFSQFLKNEVNKVSSHQTDLKLLPSAALHWKVNRRNSLTISYSLRSHTPDPEYLYTNDILTGSRNLKKGMEDLRLLSSSNYAFYYNYGELTDDFIVNIMGFWSQNNKSYSSKIVYSTPSFYSQRIIVPGSTTGNLTMQLNYYFRPIKSNIKLSTGVSQLKFYRAINNDEITPFESTSYSIGGEIRSAFESLFNFHLGTQQLISETASTYTRSFSNNNTFLDLYFRFSSQISLKLGAERYQFDRQVTNQKYYFANVSLNYQILPNKLIVGLNGSNLIDNKKFVTTNIDELMSTITEFDLKPRLLMLTFEYRY